MSKTHLLSLFAGLGLFIADDLQAQLHYQGHQGIQASYGIRTPFAAYYSIGYQVFLSNRFQLEVNGGYERGIYRSNVMSFQYNALTRHEVKNFFLHETVDYSFVRMFKRLYFNVGLGLTQSYQRAGLTEVTHSVDSLRLSDIDEPEEFNPSQVELPNGIRFGGHANLLMELYLGRYVTLLSRHRLIYMIQSNYPDWENQTLVGLRINF